MPVIRATLQDPTDMVLQGEQLRQAVLDPTFGLAVDPMLQGAPLVDPFPGVLQDEDALPPMNSYCEIGRLGVRRNKNGISFPRANAGIATPCGAWISKDWSPLLIGSVGGYERLTLSGTTRDSTGAALGNCDVRIFRTINDTEMVQLQSDASGNWSVQVSEPGPFYYVCYKVGPPDLAGTSINTNVPTKTN